MISTSITLIATDARFAARRWARSRWYPLTAALILAFGIGGTAALFAVVDSVLTQSSRWPMLDRLVAIYAVVPDRRSDPSAAASWDRAPLPAPAVDQLRKRPEFDEIGPWFRFRFILKGPAPDTVEVWYASTSMLSLLGSRAVLGRLFQPVEESDWSDVVLLSYECWQRRFGATVDVIGQRIVLAPTVGEEEGKTIIGVLSPGLGMRGERPEFVLPIGLRARLSAENYVIARLSPDTSLKAAAATFLPSVAEHLNNPAHNTARISPLIDDVFGHLVPPLWLLLGGAGLLLVTACANVGGLLFADFQERRYDLTVRTALGGSRLGIIRQIAVEQVMLASTSGVLGVLLANWMIPLLKSIAPVELQAIPTRIDIRVASIGIGFGILTVTLASVVPAVMWLMSSGSIMQSETGHTTSHRAAHRAIVVAEIALSFVLVNTAVLFSETLVRLRALPIGFDASRLAVVSIKVTEFPDVVPPPGQLPLFASWRHTDTLLERVARLPGVLSVAGAGTAPFLGGWRSERVHVVGRPDDEQSVHVQVVTNGYFGTLGLPLLSGRVFDQADRVASPLSSPRRVLVSQELQSRLLGQEALGRRLVRRTSPGATPIVYEVIGIVGNAKQREFTEGHTPTLYVQDSTYSGINDLLIKTSGDPADLLQAVRHTILDFDRSALVTHVTTMNALLRKSAAQEQFRATVAILVAAAALVLVAAGLAGLASRAVSDRRREIAVRMVLGAGASSVRLLVVREAIVVVCFGVAIGVPAALSASSLVRSFLFGVSPNSTHVLIVAAAVLALVTVGAMLVPARRAGRIDPAHALRAP